MPRLVDVTAAAGIDFRHHHGGTGEKHLPETMGSGVGWLDYDRDGRWDLYLVDSGPLPQRPASDGGGGGAADRSSRGGTGTDRSGPSRVATETQEIDAGASGGRPPGANALYRAGPDGRFAWAPQAGAADRGYGMGVSVADYDGDGWPDVHVNNFGPNSLYRNNGDGTFSDVTDRAGVGDSRWSVSSAWGDLDDDGFPELYVANYVAYDLANPLYCGELDKGIRSYCHISLFDGVADALYRNRGDGGFDDVSAAAGIVNAQDGKGLGVVMGDVDDDGRLDIYVANDTARNFLYLNRGDLAFEDVGLVAGVGYSEDGKAQAGMGTDLGDVDGDGGFEIVVTNFAFEPVNLYRAVAPGIWLDDTFPLGIGEPTLPTLGFGVALVDLDADGDLDLTVANGHILDNVEELKDNTTYAQPNQVLVNRSTELRGAGGGRPERGLFTDVTREAGEAVARSRVSRGLAVGDYDGDGRPDLAVTSSNGPAELLHNETPDGGRRLVLRLVGRQANRDALGARVRVFPGGADPPRVREVKSGASYASQSAGDLYVGLGGSPGARLEVRWPGGGTEVVERVEADRMLLIVEGRGVVAQRSLAAGSGNR